MKPTQTIEEEIREILDHEEESHYKNQLIDNFLFLYRKYRKATIDECLGEIKEKSPVKGGLIERLNKLKSKI